METEDIVCGNAVLVFSRAKNSWAVPGGRYIPAGERERAERYAERLAEHIPHNHREMDYRGSYGPANL